MSPLGNYHFISPSNISQIPSHDDIANWLRLPQLGHASHFSQVISRRISNRCVNKHTQILTTPHASLHRSLNHQDTALPAVILRCEKWPTTSATYGSSSPCMTTTPYSIWTKLCQTARQCFKMHSHSMWKSNIISRDCLVGTSPKPSLPPDFISNLDLEQLHHHHQPLCVTGRVSSEDCLATLHPASRYLRGRDLLRL